MRNTFNKRHLILVLLSLLNSGISTKIGAYTSPKLLMNNRVLVGENNAEEDAKIRKEKKAQKLKEEREEQLSILKQKANTYLEEIGIIDEKPQCNSDLLKIFGIESDLKEPIFVTRNVKQYCRRNEITCCENSHIEATQMNYYNSANKLRKRLELLEELFVMFKGPARDRVIGALTGEKCQYVFDRLKISRDEFTSSKYLDMQSDTIGSLLVDLEIYIKRQQWFFANTICTLCNPLNHKHFQIEDKKLTITSHVSICSEILEIRDFEIRVAEIFDKFINPFVNLVNCLNKEDKNEEDKEASETDKEESKGKEENKDAQKSSDDQGNKDVQKSSVDQENKDNSQNVTNNISGTKASNNIEEAQDKSNIDQKDQNKDTQQQIKNENQDLEKENNPANDTKPKQLENAETEEKNDKQVNESNPANNTESKQLENAKTEEKNDEQVNESNPANDTESKQLENAKTEEKNDEQANDKNTANNRKLEEGEEKLGDDKKIDQGKLTDDKSSNDLKDDQNKNVKTEDKQVKKTHDNKENAEKSDNDWIDSIDIAKMQELKKTVSKCYYKRFNVNESECMDICHKNFDSYAFPIDFFDKVAQALKIIFNGLIEDGNIKEYYKEIKKDKFVGKGNDVKIEFYSLKSENQQNVIKDIVWEYKSDDGITIFADHMSKKYINWKSAAITAIGVAFFSFRILF